MSNISSLWRLAKLPLAVSLASSLVVPAYAVSFNIGEIEGQFDSTLSVGASWSMANPNKDFIGAVNGGTGYTQTGDDGRLNFKKGDVFSKIFKGIHDLELRYGDSGVFARGKYWYDFELKDNDQRFKNVEDKGRKIGAKSSGYELLDAFVYHNYSIGDQPGSVRLGKQVVSWGESTFIMNGINAANPIDVAAFRRPGAELKEGLIPVNMFYVSQSITDQLSMETFYQLGWKQTVIDNCGTFFSGADVAATGCNDNYDILSKDLVALLNGVDNLNAASALFPAPLAPVNTGGVGIANGPEGLTLRRSKDDKAKDSGQWGLALRWQGDNTEYGAYFMNYHSRVPFLSMRNASRSAFADLEEVARGIYNVLGIQTLMKSQGLSREAATVAWAGSSNTPNPNAWYGGARPTSNLADALWYGSEAMGIPSANGLAGAALAVGNGSYFMDYPENIRLYGLSFSTSLPTGTAWQGEVSYRPNAPVALNTQQLTLSLAKVNADTFGADIKGYDRKPITQLQTTFTHFFDQVLGAERLTLVGEVGFTHVGDLESKSENRYGRDPIFGVTGSLIDPKETSLARYGDHGFVTTNSWGYRVRGMLDYNDVFAGINLRPNLAFSHDVDGYGPNGTFNEGAKAVSIGLDAEYQNTYTASISYTDFFGGKFNTLVDRDFLSVSVGMSF